MEQTRYRACKDKCVTLVSTLAPGSIVGSGMTKSSAVEWNDGGFRDGRQEYFDPKFGWQPCEGAEGLSLHGSERGLDTPSQSMSWY